MQLLLAHIIFVDIISSIYSTYRTYKEWKDNPTITTVNTTAYPIKLIDYPAITICSQGASKDVMDVVLMRQFEDYLKSKKIKSGHASAKPSTNSTSSKQNGKSIVKRRKRSIEPNIAFTLSKEEASYRNYNFVNL